MAISGSTDEACFWVPRSESMSLAVALGDGGCGGFLEVNLQIEGSCEWGLRV